MGLHSMALQHTPLLVRLWVSLSLLLALLSRALRLLHFLPVPLPSLWALGWALGWVEAWMWALQSAPQLETQWADQ